MQNYLHLLEVLIYLYVLLLIIDILILFSRFAHVGLAIITVLDILLVSGLHIQYGIADKYMVLWGSALADAINQFKYIL